MFSIGCDPEVLLANHSGVFVSAIGKLPGTKDAPVDVEHGKVHVDNVAGEFNTRPAYSMEQFDESIRLMLDTMKELVQAQDLEVTEKAVGIYSQEELSHPDAMKGGCEPDFDAYCDGMMNQSPPLGAVPIRCAGGHVHIGIDGLSEEDIRQLIKTLDVFVTIPMLKYEDPMRRVLYGGAGAFRRKAYGVEYRTPSNFWIFKKARREWMYRQVALAIHKFKDVVVTEYIKTVINDHRLVDAENIINQFGLEVCPE
jgi:hypothetical protein